MIDNEETWLVQPFPPLPDIDHSGMRTPILLSDLPEEAEINTVMRDTDEAKFVEEVDEVVEPGGGDAVLGIVLFSFDPDAEDELTLREGETLNVLDRTRPDGWWYGERGGRCGLFPASYVMLHQQEQQEQEVIPPLSQTTPTHHVAHMSLSDAKAAWKANAQRRKEMHRIAEERRFERAENELFQQQVLESERKQIEEEQLRQQEAKVKRRLESVVEAKASRGKSAVILSNISTPHRTPTKRPATPSRSISQLQQSRRVETPKSDKGKGSRLAAHRSDCRRRIMLRSRLDADVSKAMDEMKAIDTLLLSGHQDIASGVAGAAHRLAEQDTEHERAAQRLSILRVPKGSITDTGGEELPETPGRRALYSMESPLHRRHRIHLMEKQRERRAGLVDTQATLQRLYSSPVRRTETAKHQQSRIRASPSPNISRLFEHHVPRNERGETRREAVAREARERMSHRPSPHKTPSKPRPEQAEMSVTEDEEEDEPVMARDAVEFINEIDVDEEVLLEDVRRQRDALVAEARQKYADRRGRKHDAELSRTVEAAARGGADTGGSS